MPSPSSPTETIVLGGGCFWCTEAVFDRVQGVVDVESGYSNGQTLNPSYEQICTGRTGHAEVVKVTFDPAEISLREILEIFFVVHDPTTLNRQGNDVGTQYRSGIYYLDAAQKQIAEDVMREIGESKTYRSPIVTEVEPLATAVTTPWLDTVATLGFELAHVTARPEMPLPAESRAVATACVV